MRLLLKHPGADLVAITSRQYAGQTLAQVFPKFSHYPKGEIAALSPSRMRNCWRRVRSSLPRSAARRRGGVRSAAAAVGCTVIDLSADFRLKSAAVYKEFYAHDHPAPELLAKSVYGLPEMYRDGNSRRFGGVPRVLSDEHFAADAAVDRAKLVEPAGNHCRCVERRQRRGAQGGVRLPVRGMQRKHAAVRRAEASASFGNRAGTFEGGGRDGDDSVHAAPDSGESRDFDDAFIRSQWRNSSQRKESRS